MCEAVLERCEAWIHEQVLSPHHRRHTWEQRVVAGHEQNPSTVAGLIHVRRGREAVNVPHTRHRLAESGLNRDARVEQRDRTADQAHVNMLTLSGLVPVLERSEDADRCVQRRGVVNDVRAGEVGRSVRDTGEVHDSGDGLGDEVEARIPCSGSRLAVPGHTRHDESRVECVKHIPSAPHLLHRSGPEVLHHDVRLGDQPAQQFLRLRVSQVEAHAALVAVEHHEIDALVVESRHERPRVVAEILALHLDNVSAEITELHCAVRPGDVPRQVDHLESCERCR